LYFIIDEKMAVQKQGNPPTTHTVKAGEILFDIAQAYYGDGNQWKRIAEKNGIQYEGNNVMLTVDQKLTIPAP
jgi:nucleoid-associated protein YgaU